MPGINVHNASAIDALFVSHAPATHIAFSASYLTGKRARVSASLRLESNPRDEPAVELEIFDDCLAELLRR